MGFLLSESFAALLALQLSLKLVNHRNPFLRPIHLDSRTQNEDAQLLERLLCIQKQK